MDPDLVGADIAAQLRAAGAGSGSVAVRAGDATAELCWGGMPRAAAVEAGSVTKVITGLLFAAAIERGEVAPQDPLGRYLPVRSAAGEATLAQLATHTSGLARVPAAQLRRTILRPGNPYRGVSLEQLIRWASRAHRSDVGTSAYSNFGVALLGQALSSAAGEQFWTLAQSRVLEPLGMHDSGDLADNAIWSGGRPLDPFAAFAPAGGLRATTADLLRLARLAAEPGTGPLARVAAAALQEHHVAGTGWCWRLRACPRGPMAWHNGGTGSAWSFVGGAPGLAIAATAGTSRRPGYDTALLTALGA